jgi:hypothetical protein
MFITQHAPHPQVKPTGKLPTSITTIPDGVICLSPEQIGETGVGDPWLEIFLWEGATYVGTTPEIGMPLQTRARASQSTRL